MAKQPENIVLTTPAKDTAAPVAAAAVPLAAVATMASPAFFSRSRLFSNKALFIMSIVAVSAYFAWQNRALIKRYFGLDDTKKRVRWVDASLPAKTETNSETVSEDKLIQSEAPPAAPEASTVVNADGNANEAPITLEDFESLAREVDQDIGFNEEEQQEMERALERQENEAAQEQSFQLPDEQRFEEITPGLEEEELTQETLNSIANPDVSSKRRRKR